MLGALAGLPSLGGLGGGFGGGGLPMLGFGLLSALTSTLTTRSFLGPTTDIPSLSSTNINFGNLNTNFGNYAGTSGQVGSSSLYFDDPSLHTGPSSFGTWHAWATGGVQPPLTVAPLNFQTYGSAGSYGPVSYGTAGSYGMGVHGTAGYCPPPIFGGYMTPVPNPTYTPVPYPGQTPVPQPTYTSVPYPGQTPVPQPTYTSVPYPGQTPVPYPHQTPVPQQNYIPQNYYPQYGAQDQQRNDAFNAWANDALARFNASNSAISATYNQSQTGNVTNYGPVQPTYVNSVFNQQTSQAYQQLYGNFDFTTSFSNNTISEAQRHAMFQSYTNEALASFNAQSVSINGAVGYGSPPPIQAPPAPVQPLPPGYSFPTYSQPPAYGAYQGYYQGLPAYGAPSYGAYNSCWCYPSQPPVFYQPALPSYTAPVMQHQTPYGYGGPPQPAPCPPPPPYQTEPRPPYVPPVDTPPRVEVPPVVTPGPRTRNEYPRIPVVANDFGQASQVLGSRLVGDPAKIAAFTNTNPPPMNNQDSLRFDRIGAYFVMQQDSSLRYNVDTGRFFRTYSTGETKDVVDMAQISQMLRQEHPDQFGRVGQLLSHLPSDDQLFGARGPAGAGPAGGSGTPSPTFVYGASPINPGFVPPPQPINLPPVQPGTLPPPQPANLPPFAGFPNSGGQVPALDQLVKDRAAGTVTGNDFNLELIRIAAQTGAINPNPMQAQPAKAPFTITAHRYWDSAAGQYSDVSEILVMGGENPNDVQRVFNPNKQTSVVVNKDGVPLGNPMRVTVTWENGQSRVWDYQVSDEKGSDVDVFSPLG